MCGYVWWLPVFLLQLLLLLVTLTFRVRGEERGLAQIQTGLVL